MFKVYQQTQNLKMKLLKKVSKYHEVKNQRGMTLLEIIIVLGIVGTIAAGVVVLAQRAFDSRAISDLVSNTNSIRIAAKEAYQRAPGYPAEQEQILRTIHLSQLKTQKNLQQLWHA